MHRRTTLQDLMDETPTMKLLGGLRQSVHKQLGRQEELGEAFQEGHNYGREIGTKEGLNLGKSIGTKSGFIEGVQRTMLKGDKYILLKHGQNEPLVYSNFKNMIDSNPDFLSTLVKRELGTSYETSAYPNKAEEMAIDEVSRDITKVNVALNEAEKIYRQKYETRKQSYEKGYNDLSKTLDALNLKTAETPFILTDDWNMYNTETMRKYYKNLKPDNYQTEMNELKKRLDWRNLPTYVDPNDFKSFIFSPVGSISHDETALATTMNWLEKNIPQSPFLPKIEQLIVRKPERPKLNLQPIPFHIPENIPKKVPKLLPIPKEVHIPENIPKKVPKPLPIPKEVPKPLPLPITKPTKPLPIPNKVPKPLQNTDEMPARKNIGDIDSPIVIVGDISPHKNIKRKDKGKPVYSILNMPPPRKGSKTKKVPEKLIPDSDSKKSKSDYLKLREVVKSDKDEVSKQTKSDKKKKPSKR